jgi:hypothetical protein
VERYWFNIVTREVETDGEPGRRGDRMGPYRTREEAARALDSARLRTIAWDASDADSRERSTWTPPPPAPLGRSERWVLARRRPVRAGLLTLAAVLALVMVVTWVVGGRPVPLTALIVFAALYGTHGIRSLERRARELGEDVERR